MPARNGAALHVHDRLHEYFYLLDGEIRLQIDTELMTAGTGSSVSIPPGTPHGFVVVGETARVLNMYTPAVSTSDSGSWRLRFLATPAQAKTLPPSPVVLDEATADQEAAFIDRLKQIQNERWADDVTDLLADERS